MNMEKIYNCLGENYEDIHLMGVGEKKEANVRRMLLLLIKCCAAEYIREALNKKNFAQVEEVAMAAAAAANCLSLKGLAEAALHVGLLCVERRKSGKCSYKEMEDYIEDMDKYIREIVFLIGYYHVDTDRTPAPYTEVGIKAPKAEPEHSG